MKLSKEHIKGHQFEMWVEQLLRELELKNVRRNVVYSRSRYRFRQVDLEYTDSDKNNTLVILELKYTGNGRINLKLRRKKQKNGQLIEKIDDLIEEVEERRRFIGARLAILMTNKYFKKEVYEKVKSCGYPIHVADIRHLSKLERDRRKIRNSFNRPGSIEEQIRSIYVREHEINPVRVRVNYEREGNIKNYAGR